MYIVGIAEVQNLHLVSVLLLYNVSCDLYS